MWSVVLKILSILGIILLCLLALALVTLFLVLFCPVSYRGGGSARAGKYCAWFRFWWFFGLVRGACEYSGSGSLRIKVLWLTVCDRGGKQKKSSPEDGLSEQGVEEREQSEKAPPEEEKQTQPKQAAAEAEGQIPPNPAASGEVLPDEAGGPSASPQREADRSPGGDILSDEIAGPSTEASADKGKQSQKAIPKDVAEQARPLSEKLSGLKEKLRFWLEIVRDEDNQGLVKHGLARLGKILKSVRPRFLRAEVLMGLEEPDLTGYAYGIYWALKPFLGKKCQATVTPDFERQVLEGEAVLGGRIMAAVLLYHAVRVLFDRRLRRLLDKLKKQE